MYIKFSAAAFYIIVIACILTFIYAMIGLGVLEPYVPDQDLLGTLLQPSFVFTLGTAFVICEKWWRLRDPHRMIFLILPRVQTWGYLLILIGLVMFGNHIYKNGLSPEMQMVILLTAAFNALLAAAFAVRKKIKR